MEHPEWDHLEWSIWTGIIQMEHPEWSIRSGIKDGASGMDHPEWNHPEWTIRRGIIQNGTFGMGQQSVLIRGPIEDDAVANVSAWPVPGTPVRSCSLQNGGLPDHCLRLSSKFVCLFKRGGCLEWQSFQLIDDPFIVHCLELAVEAPFHFCHCAYGFRTPGAKGMGFHQVAAAPAAAPA